VYQYQISDVYGIEIRNFFLFYLGKHLCPDVSRGCAVGIDIGVLHKGLGNLSVGRGRGAAAEAKVQARPDTNLGVEFEI